MWHDCRNNTRTLTNMLWCCLDKLFFVSREVDILYKDLTDYLPDDILRELEANNDLTNTTLILQLIEVNILAKIDENATPKNESDSAYRDGLVVDDEDDVDDLLSSTKSLNPKQELKQSAPVDNDRGLAKDKQLLERVQSILKSIMDRPKEFLGENPHKKVNKILGVELLPSTKSIRSAISAKILIRLANGRIKGIHLSEDMSRMDAAEKIRKHQKEKSMSTEIS